MSDTPEADWSTLGATWSALILIQFAIYVFLYLSDEISLWYFLEPFILTFVVLALFGDDEHKTTWALILFAYTLLATIGKLLWAWGHNDLNVHTAHNLYHFVEVIVIATAFRAVSLAMAEKERQGGSERDAGMIASEPRLSQRAGRIARERRLLELLRRQEIAKTAHRVSQKNDRF